MPIESDGFFAQRDANASALLNQPVMIMVAPTGARMSKSDNPAIPMTPAEIADDVVRCAEAGACIAHLHARDVTGSPTQDAHIFAEIIERVRDRSEIVLQLSLGTVGFTVEEVTGPLVLFPEMVSFPMRAFSSGSQTIPKSIVEMAARINSSNAVPELDIKDEAMIRGAANLVRSGLVELPVFFGINVMEPVDMRDGVERLLRLTRDLPEESQWWLTKGGRMSLGLRAFAIELGGNVRVGLEDSIYEFGTRTLASSNASLVERMTRLCSSLGRSVATPSDVRELIRTRRGSLSWANSSRPSEKRSSSGGCSS